MARVLYPTSAMFGATGEIDVARADFAGLSSDRGHFFVVLAVAAVAAFVLHRVDRGTFGRLLRAMADHSEGVAALGVSPLVLRAAAFAIASFFAGVGGALLATINETASTAAFEPSQSMLWIAVLAIGGTGVVAAGIRGALAAALMPYFLEPFIGGNELLLLFGLAAMIAAAARGRAGRTVVAGRFDRLVERASVGAEWRLARSPVTARMETP
jgi:ABC-type branched-subunit amino acid transport system permease subunit